MHGDFSHLRISCRALRTLIASALLISATACQSDPTGYRRAGGVWGADYGYTDKAIGNDEYSVAVTGNLRTSKARVADIALLRAAHLSNEHRRTHFVIVIQRADEVTQREMVTVPVWAGMLIFVPVGETRATREPHAALIIRLLPNDGQRPDNAIDASAVIAELGARLERPVGT